MMPIRDHILPEFDHEMAGTRRSLERVPDDRMMWKPHEKSSSMGSLATHLARLPYWAVQTITRDSIDIAPSDGSATPSAPATSRRELLEMFDRNVAEARAAIAVVSDETLMKPWSMLAGGRVLFTMPKVTVLRGFVVNHIIHHRAQLGVYLRLNDIPVPALYGPTADERGM
jgi:uncharacterized damage-inducible protein DinB